MIPTVIIGSGGHAKVIIDILRAAGRYRPAVCVAADLSTTEVLGVPVVGTDDRLPQLYADGMRHAFVAIGDNRLRGRLIDRLRGLSFQLAMAVSPAAHLAASAHIGRGTAVMPGACVGSDARLGSGVVVNTGAVVDHDCVLGDASHVGPGAALAGCVSIGREAFVGTGASILPNRIIGERALVGAGAVVIRDVPNDVTVAGVPARPIRRRVNAPHPRRRAG